MPLDYGQIRHIISTPEATAIVRDATDRCEQHIMSYSIGRRVDAVQPGRDWDSPYARESDHNIRPSKEYLLASIAAAESAKFIPNAAIELVRMMVEPDDMFNDHTLFTCARWLFHVCNAHMGVVATHDHSRYVDVHAKSDMIRIAAFIAEVCIVLHVPCVVADRMFPSTVMPREAQERARNGQVDIVSVLAHISMTLFDMYQQHRAGQHDASANVRDLQ